MAKKIIYQGPAWGLFGEQLFDEFMNGDFQSRLKSGSTLARVNREADPEMTIYRVLPAGVGVYFVPDGESVRVELRAKSSVQLSRIESIILDEAGLERPKKNVTRINKEVTENIYEGEPVGVYDPMRFFYLMMVSSTFTEFLGVRQTIYEEDHPRGTYFHIRPYGVTVRYLHQEEGIKIEVKGEDVRVERIVDILRSEAGSLEFD